MAAEREATAVTNPDPSITAEEGPASLFCRQCQAAYRQPRILKCLHSFCTPCLDEVAAKEADKTRLPCPTCSFPTKLPPGGVVKDLPLNSFLQRVSQEYLTDFKTSLGLKSAGNKSCPEYDESSSTTTTTSVVGHGISSTVHQDLDQCKFVNMTDEQKFNSSRKHSLDSFGETGIVQEEALQNMSRLQAKMMGLQGEALRVTYAIDRVNHNKIEWMQHREDLKRAIQRRSAQFQMMVKKTERHLLSQIDDKHIEDRLYESFERGKTELRKNLKQVLHEVSVLKGVREMGTYGEINEISPSLLGASVGINEVVLDKVSYQLDLPTKSIEEMVRVGFGNLVKTTEDRSVYLPEMKDYANLKMDEINAEVQSSHSFSFNRAGIVSAISGDTVAKAGRTRSSSVIGRQTQRRGSDHGKAGVLEEFQSARESLRNRRQEILQQGHHSAETSSRRGGETARLSRPPTRRSRGQSLDRGFLDKERNKTILRLKSDGKTDNSQEDDDHDASSTSSTDTGGASDHTTVTFKSDVTMPSPIIEENAALASPTLKGTHTVSATATTHQSAKPMSPGGALVTEKMSFQDMLHASRSPNSPCSSTSSSRRVSFDHSPSISPTTDHTFSELHGRTGDGTRPLRRAITSAADKKTKIEFLRENWQKRKEILIQTQGFVSSEENKSPKPDSKAMMALISSSANAGDGASKAENGEHSQIPLASRGVGSPPLRSKFTSVKKAQLEQRKYQEKSDTAKLIKSSSTESEDNAKTTRGFVIPESVLGKEIKSIEDRRDGRGQTTTATKQVTASVGKMNTEEEEEEEVVVMETETITIPLKTQISKDLKSENSAKTDSMLSSRYSSTDAKQNIDQCERQQIENESNTLGNKRTVAGEVPKSSLTQALLSQSSSTRLRTEPVPPSTITAAKNTSTSSIDTRTTTLPSAPVTTSLLSSDTKAASGFVPSSSTVKTTSHAVTYTKIEPPTPVTLQTTGAVTATTLRPSMATTTTSTSTTTTTPSSFQPTSVATSALPSPSASSTVSSSQSQRRYVPKVQHIDVSSLFANLYKAPTTPSPSSADASKSDDNKENVVKQDTNSISNTQNTTKQIRNSSLYTATQPNVDTKTESSLKIGRNEDATTRTSTADQNLVSQNRDLTTQSRAFEKSYATPARQSTVSLPTAATTTLQDTRNNQSSASEPTKTTTFFRVSSADTNDSMDAGKTQSDSPKSPLQTRSSTSSMYSRFYSNPSSLYSKPPEVKSKVQEEHEAVSIQDQMVDKTFTQAESTRRRYDPAVSKAARNRRHTVEVSKTLPAGVKILDLYKGQDTGTGLRSPHMVATETIEESPTETEHGDAPRNIGTSQRPHHSLLFQPSGTSPTFSRGGGLLPKQQSLPDKSELRYATKSTMSSSGQRIPLSPTTHLSAASSPASSPLTEDKKFILSGDDAGGAAGANPNSKNLKDIARKKRERWRRLTVY